MYYCILGGIMKEEYLFLDTNVFIDCNDNISELEKILKYSEKKGWKFSISMYTLLELKANEKTEPIINFICKNFCKILIVPTEIKGMNMKLYKFKSINDKKNSILYKKEKKEYEMKCIVYLCLQIGIVFQDIFASEKIFNRKFEDLLEYRDIKTLEEDKKFVNEYLEKIIKEILLFYNGTEEINKQIKQKIKSKKEKLKKELIIDLQKSNIENQSDFMIKLILENYLEMVYRKICNIKENLDKNNFLDILFINLIETKQILMTRDKWILEKIKSYGYSEIEKYNIYSLMGIQKLNVLR